MVGSQEPLKVTQTTSGGDLGSDSDIRTSFRFEAVKILHENGILCKIWGEDALQYYGARTVAFDLFLLVDNPEEAGKCLESYGYTRALPNPRYRFTEELQVLPRFKNGPFSEDEDNYATYLAFIKAQQVRFTFPAEDIPDVFPTFPALVDSIIDAWLDAETTSYAMHLASHLGYIKGYCPKARDPLLVGELKPGHRNFYQRALSHPGIGAEREEWRRVRDSFPEVT